MRKQSTPATGATDEVLNVFRTMLRAKIHRATVTDADLHYEGSLTVDTDLMDAAGMLPYELVQVVNVNNGSRLETYLIAGARGSGVVCLNGAAARLGAKGDKVIVMTYAVCTEEEARAIEPRVVLVDDANHIRRPAMDASKRPAGGDHGHARGPVTTPLNKEAP